jgi:hypothetical protein
MFACARCCYRPGIDQRGIFQIALGQGIADLGVFESLDDALNRHGYAASRQTAQEVTMKNMIAPLPLLLSAVTLAGCQIVGDIFKAGVWVGVIGVVAVIAIVIWLISRAVS